MIKAEILADSINHHTGDRLTTFLLKYPRFIHSELMTHRMLSRNASSSRAIPVEKMISMIREEPAMPVTWPKNQKGMQASEYLSGGDLIQSEIIWLDAMEEAAERAELLIKIGVHKQIANRVLEPWAHMTTLVSATEWGNFFRLRAHPDAQPEFQELAFEMLELYVVSKPQVIQSGGWHLPYKPSQKELESYTGGSLMREQTLLKVAVARCARTSYVNFDGSFSISKDVKLHDLLVQSGHYSPFEHVAKPALTSACHGNFRGWMQYRRLVEPDYSHDRISQNELEMILSRRGPKRG